MKAILIAFGFMIGLVVGAVGTSNHWQSLNAQLETDKQALQSEKAKVEQSANELVKQINSATIAQRRGNRMVAWPSALTQLEEWVLAYREQQGGTLIADFYVCGRIEQNRQVHANGRSVGTALRKAD